MKNIDRLLENPPRPAAEKVHTNPETQISESFLSVTLGKRLAKAAPMKNIRGDRPVQEEDDD